MGTQVNDLGTTFKQAWYLLMQNLIIVIPGLIVSVAVIVPLIILVLAGVGGGFSIAGIGHATTSIPGGNGVVAIAIAVCAIFFIVAFAFVIALTIAQIAFVTGMANIAWEGGHATLSDGWNAFRERGWTLFYVFVLLTLLGIAATLLSLFTLLFSFIAYLVFFLYVPPLVVIGKRSATQAIAESCRLAVRDFWPTVLLAAASIGIAIAASLVSSIFSHLVLFVGIFVAIVIPLAANAYTTILIVGHYRKLSHQA